jgi:hypothetical protein
VDRETFTFDIYMDKTCSDTDTLTRRLVNADLYRLLRKETTKKFQINTNNNIGTSNKVITKDTGRYRICCYSSNSLFKFSKPATMNIKTTELRKNPIYNLPFKILEAKGI